MEPTVSPNPRERLVAMKPEPFLNGVPARKDGLPEMSSHTNTHISGNGSEQGTQCAVPDTGPCGDCPQRDRGIGVFSLQRDCRGARRPRDVAEPVPEAAGAVGVQRYDISRSHGDPLAGCIRFLDGVETHCFSTRYVCRPTARLGG